jgi:hypothetical protein
MPAMKIAKLVLAASLAAGSVVAILACGDDDPKTHVTPAECEPIAERCHPVQTPAAQECHESAEATWTAAECTEHLSACLAECPEPDAGPPGTPDAAVVDASGEPDAEADAETP